MAGWNNNVPHNIQNLNLQQVDQNLHQVVQLSRFNFLTYEELRIVFQFGEILPRTLTRHVPTHGGLYRVETDRYRDTNPWTILPRPPAGRFRMCASYVLRGEVMEGHFNYSYVQLPHPDYNDYYRVRHTYRNEDDFPGICIVHYRVVHVNDIYLQDNNEDDDVEDEILMLEYLE